MLYSLDGLPPAKAVHACQVCSDKPQLALHSSLAYTCNCRTVQALLVSGLISFAGAKCTARITTLISRCLLPLLYLKIGMYAHQQTYAPHHSKMQRWHATATFLIKHADNQPGPQMSLLTAALHLLVCAERMFYTDLIWTV